MVKLLVKLLILNRFTIWRKILLGWLSAEESRVSHPAHANENLKVIRKFFVLLLVGMDGMDSAFGRVPEKFHMVGWKVVSWGAVQ